MSRRGAQLLALLIAVALLTVWGFNRRTAPAEVQFAKVTRGAIISSLKTNGKVEPIEWASARAERAGVVQKVFAQRGQQVRAGQPLIALDASDATSQLAAAEAQIAEARAQQEVLKEGGRRLDRTQIEGELAAARLTLETAQNDLASLQRLVDKQAATRYDLDQARRRVDQAQLQIRALEQRRGALVAPTDTSVAAARANQAESAAESARRNISYSVVKAPMNGTVYSFDLRKGSYVGLGDLVANVGQIEQVRVTVYVDEPDLGRVGVGMPVTITWDAMPGRQWKGSVDRLPTQVVPLGTRQVGEVSSIIDNPDRELLPGTNVNAEILSKVVPDALMIPTGALRRQGLVTGVYLLAGNEIVWRPVETGVSSYTNVQITRGLSAGDSVALPADRPLKEGHRVKPVYP